MGVIHKINNNVNIIGANIKKFRELQQLFQPDLCRKLQLIGVTMFIADIYEIENNKRLVKDFEVKSFCKVLKTYIVHNVIKYFLLYI